MRPHMNFSSAYVIALTAIASVILGTATIQAASTTYTLDSQFDQGTLQNINHNAPNNDQLQLNIIGTGFPVLWVANAGEDTLSKFDTTQQGTSPGREVARYHTWFSSGTNSAGDSHGAWGGPAPSRTAVDVEGNAYVLNRHFDGRPALLIKVLANGFIDRNGNGVVDTSTDGNNDGIIQASEMKPLLDNNANNILDPTEIEDERIAWAVRVPDGLAAPSVSGQLGRALCIGTDSNLWVGLYNNKSYYKVSGLDGHTITGPISTAPTAGKPNAGSWTPYGCLIDQNGVLWSASLSNLLGKIENTANNAPPYPVSSFYYGYSNYGIALGQDATDGHTIVYTGGSYNSYSRFDTATNTFSSPASTWTSSYAVNTDGGGNILVSKINGGVIKFAPNGTVVWNKNAQAGTAGDTRGVMPDANNDIWQIHLATSKTAKFQGTNGDALGSLPTGLSPYTYSDASGFAAANITVTTGTWTKIQDSGTAGTTWGKVTWNADIPDEASVIVSVRTAETEVGLGAQSFTVVNNGVDFNLAGRYIEVQVRLTANNSGDSPIVYDVTIASAALAKCDIDKDGDIDKIDTALISRARGQQATANDPRDADSDGLITPNDVKVCIPQCTRAYCAIQ